MGSSRQLFTVHGYKTFPNLVVPLHENLVKQIDLIVTLLHVQVEVIMFNHCPLTIQYFWDQEWIAEWCLPLLPSLLHATICHAAGWCHLHGLTCCTRGSSLSDDLDSTNSGTLVSCWTCFSAISSSSSSSHFSSSMRSSSWSLIIESSMFIMPFWLSKWRLAHSVILNLIDARDVPMSWEVGDVVGL